MSSLLTPRLQEFLSVVLDQALDDAVHGHGLVPFGALLYGEEPFLFQLPESDGELAWDEHLSMLRKELRSIASDPEREGPDAVAVVYDTFVSVEGERSEAIGVEAYEPGARSAILLAQCYRTHSEGRFGGEEGDVMVLRDDLEPLT